MNTQRSQSVGSEAQPAPKSKAVVVGLYGVPGSGKSFLLAELSRSLDNGAFKFYEGSEKIASLVPGGLDAFHSLGEQEKLHWRHRAIQAIREESTDSGCAAVVAGHFMFWTEGEEVGNPVFTQADLESYTHILYLDVPAELVEERRSKDSNRSRPLASVDHLRKWQQAEQKELRQLCRQHSILYSTVSSPPSTLLNRISALLADFHHQDEEYSLSRAQDMLDSIIKASTPRGGGHLETALVMDADKTLIAEDTGVLFWKLAASSHTEPDNYNCPLKQLFSSPLGYSYNAFRQATLLYEEAFDDDTFGELCDRVASSVTTHPEFVQLLKIAARQEHVLPVVVTCGLRRVWERVLEIAGLSEAVRVIGGGRLTDGFVVTPDAKAALVERLQHIWGMRVCAFGDGVLDLPMMRVAHQAVVVVGEEHTRSKSMDAALLNAIDAMGLRAQQVLLPSHAAPRLDTIKLPLVQLGDPSFLNPIFRPREQPTAPKILCITSLTAAKLLMTPTRNAEIQGPALREAHRLVGWYLAVDLVAELVGTEEFLMPHVQGHQTPGYRLLGEDETVIVALMRGGEPMALGINDAFRSAMFLHAKEPEDINGGLLWKMRTVLLVDSVVNSGKTVAEFVRHIRSLHSAIRIVVVAGVVQKQCVSVGDLAQVLEQDPKLSLVALRQSDNKFTGRGGTDTGNRLFNTTHLD